MDDLSAPSPPASKTPRRFGFAALLAVALFAINRGFSSINATPSWLIGAVWFGFGTVGLVIAIWTWEHTTQRHWVIRLILSGLVISAMAGLSYGPLTEEYRREHPVVSKTSLEDPPKPDAPGKQIAPDPSRPVDRPPPLLRTKFPSRTDVGVVVPNAYGHADLKLEFVGKDQLRFRYFADSDESANQPKRFFGLWDINHPFYYDKYPGVPQPLPLMLKTEMDFVFHNHRSGGGEVLDAPAASAHVKPGDRLFGVATVVCFNCQKERAYWVYFEVGVGGWYGEMDSAPWGQAIQVPRSDFSDEQQAAAFDVQVPKERRITIPEK